jgi:hypothetical protein
VQVGEQRIPKDYNGVSNPRKEEGGTKICPMHLGFQIVEHAQYLKRYPESNGDSLSIGKCIYDITQKLVTLTKIKESLIGD